MLVYDPKPNPTFAAFASRHYLVDQVWIINVLYFHRTSTVKPVISI